MRLRTHLSGGLILLLACSPARAQVNFDQRALDSLQGPQTAPPQGQQPTPTPGQPAPAQPAKPPPHPAAHPAAKPLPVPPKPPAHAPAATPPAPPPPKPPVVPAAPPPLPVIPPPITVPTRAEPPPPPPPITPDAPDTVAAIPGGLRVTFGEDRSDLNPATATAIKDFVHAAAQTPPPVFSIVAFAAGRPDDPSYARRTSLSRALGVRSLLLEEGVPSVRIYVRALGASAPAVAEGPADRVDLTLAQPTAPAPQQQPQAHP